ncbi:MAG: NAD(P)-dependent alcohol dehydrogenase [Chloroflexi bacterium]|nr:NAD(P)-dependent alcohol dehydrogenase [Chloroflexota bacterium]
MKAVVYRRYGMPDVFAVQDVPTSVPGDDEVLVAVQASAVNSWDWDQLRGRPLLVRLAEAPWRPKFPILGADIAGRVEAVGAKVSRFRPGDEVFGDLSHDRWGGFAEYVCAREQSLAVKPPALTFEQAAALPQAGVLALQGLRQGGPLRPGQRVLMNGAGGGVGTLAVQLAKSFGADVTGVDVAGKLDLVRSVGADQVIDYARTDFARASRQYDLILDVAARRSFAACRRALTPRGAYVIIGGATGTLIQLALLGALFAVFRSKKRVGLLVHRPSAADLAVLADLVVSGTVRPIIDRCFPLHEVPDALRYYATGQVRGKIVITVGQHGCHGGDRRAVVRSER